MYYRLLLRCVSMAGAHPPDLTSCCRLSSCTLLLQLNVPVQLMQADLCMLSKDHTKTVVQKVNASQQCKRPMFSDITSNERSIRCKHPNVRKRCPL